MFQTIIESFKKKPLLYYSMSIAASWAGAGSLMNSATMAKTLGVIPAATWCLFNTLACIAFGLIIWKLPTVRKVMRMKISKAILALFSIFQIWLCMTAINESWATTPLGVQGGMILTYGITALFIIALFRKGIIANIITDNGGMYMIYLLVLILSGVSLVKSGCSFDGLTLGTENYMTGLYKGALLLPGLFTYPYFYKLLDYNEENPDKVSHTDIIKAFIFGGLGFGLYLIFAFALIFTTISPELEICKAVLLSILAISSLSSFVYSEFAVFGKGMGLCINLCALTFWIFVAPLGVMGVWTLMAESRVHLFFVMLIASVFVRLRDNRKAVIA